MKLLWNIFMMGLTSLTVNAHAGEPTPLRLVQTIPLPNVEGRIDHIAVDLKGERLFVAALGNNTIEVLDLRAGKRIQSITGLHEPQGVGFISEFKKIYVANAKSGACDVFDASSFKVIKSVKFSDDADNIRYDAAVRRVYVGYGSGALGIIDAATGDKLGEIKLEGHPESFQLERSGSRIFVNIPNVPEDSRPGPGETRDDYIMAYRRRYGELSNGARRAASPAVCRVSKTPDTRRLRYRIR